MKFRKPKDTETEEQVIQVIKQIEKEFDIGNINRMNNYS